MKLIKDLNYALRGIARFPGTCAMIVVIMSIGLGVSITMFAFTKGILWNKIDLDQRDSLAHIGWVPYGNNRNTNIHIHDYLAIREGNSSFSELAAYFNDSPSFNYPAGNAIVKTYNSAAVSTNFFNFIEQRPLLGRTFYDDDAKAGNDRSIVISEYVWEDQFGRDPKVFEARVYCNGVPSRVVGVMPDSFEFPNNVDVWWATEFDWLQRADRGTGLSMQVIGLLKDGVTYEQAEADINRIAANMAVEFPLSNKDKTRVEVMSFRKNVHGEFLQTLLFVLLSFGALVLLVTCANVSNLLMAKTARKSFEIGLRNALGASRRHMMTLVMLEGLLLVAMGTIGGLFLATWGTKYIWGILDTFDPPYWWEIKIDGVSILVAVAATVIASLIATILPALRAAKRDSYKILQSSSRTSASGIGFFSRVLVVFQILSATALMIVALFNYTTQSGRFNREFSYDMNQLVSAVIWFNRSAGFEEEESIFQYHDRLQNRMKEEGAVSVSITSGETTGLYGRAQRFEISSETYDREEDMPRSRVISVTNEYFTTYNLQLMDGRLLNDFDQKDSQRVAVVNSAFVQTFYPGQNVLGKQIRILEPGGQMSDWTTIVGMCSNVVTKPAPGEIMEDIAFIYRPMRQSLIRGVNIVAYARGDASMLASKLGRAMSDINPNMPAKNEIQTNKENSLLYDRFPNLLVKLFAAFGIASFLVSTIGLYAIVSFTTTQRTHELGIRTALGAGAKHIIHTVTKRGVVESVIGIVFGGLLGYFGIHLLADQFGGEQIPPYWMSFAIVIPLIFVASIVGMLHPVIRSLRLDPIVALRDE